MRSGVVALICLLAAAALLFRGGEIDASIGAVTGQPVESTDAAAATADAAHSESVPQVRTDERTEAPRAEAPQHALVRSRFRVTEPDGTPIADATLVHSDPVLSTDADGRIEVERKPEAWCEFAAPSCVQGGAHAARDGSEVVVVLAPALRLCVRVRGSVDVDALHARVHLPANAKPGPYYPFVTSKYEQTPGCGVDGTNARWTHRQAVDEATGWPRWTSHWELQFSPAGTAVLDHVEFDGEAVVELCHFETVLDRRAVAFPTRRGTTEVVFERSEPRSRLRGRVVDQNGRAIADALLRAGAAGGAQVVDSQFLHRTPFPVWGPEARTDGNGRFDLPRPPEECRIVITAPGAAARAVTVAEIDAASGTVVLQPGRTILLYVVDSLGEMLVGPPTTGGEDVVEPAVHLGHDVWRGPSGGEPPWFEFDGLPPGTVEIECLGERFAHDVRLGNGRFQADCTAGELGLGK